MLDLSFKINIRILPLNKHPEYFIGVSVMGYGYRAFDSNGFK
jgi:hypothetical protein